MYAYVNDSDGIRRRIVHDQAIQLGDMITTPTNSRPILLCPNCQTGTLHQSKVEVWFRREDADQGLHAVIDDDVYINHIADTASNNPSPRRSAVQIGFTCEECWASLFLSILQHKGSTYVEWEPF